MQQVDYNAMFRPSKTDMNTLKANDIAIGSGAPVENHYRFPYTEGQVFRNMASKGMDFTRDMYKERPHHLVPIGEPPSTEQVIDDLVDDLKRSGRANDIIDGMWHSRTPEKAIEPLTMVCRHRRVHLPTLYDNNDLFKSFVDLLRVRAIGGLGFEHPRNVVIIIPATHARGNNSVISSMNGMWYHQKPVVTKYRVETMNRVLANNRQHPSLQALWNNMCTSSDRRVEEFMSRFQHNSQIYDLPALDSRGTYNLM